MKVYRINYSRTAQESITIPVDMVKTVEMFDGVVKLIGQDDTPIVAVPIDKMDYCAVIDVEPPAQPAQDPQPEE